MLSLVVSSQIIEIVKNKKLEPSFEPSMKTLLRIVKFMTENDAGGKTQLSLDTNVNYARFVKHVVWLEKNNLIESKIEENKIKIALTADGKKFASMISMTR
jgi:predicted transcriptional regulator